MHKYTSIYIYLGMCALMLTGTACSHVGMEANSSDNMLRSDEQSLEMRESAHNTAPVGTALDQQVTGAVADLATRLGIATDAISVREARTVNWASSALGCPDKGMMYTQAIVPGVLVLLAVDDTVYRYHGRRGVRLVYCPDDRAKEPAYGAGKEFM